MKRKTLGEVIFINFCTFCMIIFAIITLLPCMNVLAKSVSSEGAVMTGSVKFLPVGFQLGTYRYVLDTVEFVNGLKVSVIVTIVGTICAMFLTTTVAYPLSKPTMVGRKFFMLLFVFVMLFSGGMIPNYMLYRSLGLTNTILALILPGMCSVFNILLVKTFYEQLPESVEESARIDGASNFRTLFSVVIPMSMPVIATVSLYYSVSYWNSYFAGILYITRPALKPLQQYLYELVQASQVSPDANTITTDMTQYMNTSPESVRAATIFLATAPILMVYPFLQRYFVKGINIGSVKG
ncbi:MAG: carbohydrate ABC transporter permease [Christensenellales bacterium]|jgi:putative aldouronate transport system permease protein